MLGLVMRVLTIKDFLIAIVLAAVAYLFGGIAVGFLGALFGLPQFFSNTLAILLCVAVPFGYVMWRINEN